MAYKFDSDLEFLRQLDSNELNDLVDIIKGKEGDERITQDLTSNDLFKRFYPNHKEYIELCVSFNALVATALQMYLEVVAYNTKKFYVMFAISLKLITLRLKTHK